MSESFGSRLRQERERRHIDLAAIAADTKVKVALFEGLERDDVSRWPSGIFRRAFIRAYATAVGLDPEPIVREFVERFPDPADPPSADPSAGTAGPGRPSPREVPAPLRLTLAEGELGLWFTGGHVLETIRQRCAAAAWDAGAVLAIGISLFAVTGDFWRWLGLAMLGYYGCSILILGNTPGVALLAPRPRPTGSGEPERRETVGRLDLDLRPLEPRAAENAPALLTLAPGSVPPEPSTQSASTIYPISAARRRAR